MIVQNCVSNEDRVRLDRLCKFIAMTREGLKGKIRESSRKKFVQMEILILEIAMEEVRHQEQMELEKLPLFNPSRGA